MVSAAYRTYLCFLSVGILFLHIARIVHSCFRMYSFTHLPLVLLLTWDLSIPLSFLCSNTALSEVLITGGIPPDITSSCAADLVYAATFHRILEQNKRFYSRFPAAVERAKRIVLYLAARPGGSVTTPCGNILSPRSFQLLGLHTLGFSQGFERLHFLLESAFDAEGDLSQRFLKDYDNIMAWDTNPLYAIMHESIYCQGSASQWSAHRIRDQFGTRFDAVALAQADLPVAFTGEMVFPWMFDEFVELKKIKEAANLVALFNDWGPLYNEQNLQANSVPVAAATYFEVRSVHCIALETTNRWRMFLFCRRGMLY